MSSGEGLDACDPRMVRAMIIEDSPSPVRRKADKENVWAAEGAKERDFLAPKRGNEQSSGADSGLDSSEVVEGGSHGEAPRRVEGMESPPGREEMAELDSPDEERSPLEEEEEADDGSSPAEEEDASLQDEEFNDLESDEVKEPKPSESESTKPLETESMRLVDCQGTIVTQGDDSKLQELPEPRKPAEDIEDAVRLFTSPKCPSFGSSTLRLQAGLDEMLSEQTAQSHASQEHERQSEYHSTCNPSPPVFVAQLEPPTERQDYRELLVSYQHVNAELSQASADRERLYQELGQVHSQLESLKDLDRKYEELEKALAAAKAELTQAEQYTGDCADRERQTTQELSELKIEHRGLVDELRDLKQKLEEVQNELEDAVNAQRQSEVARAHIEDMKSELEKAKTRIDELKETEVALGRLQTEYDSLRERLQEENEALRMEVRMRQLEEQKLREELSSTVETLECSRIRLMGTQKAEDGLRAELARAAEERSQMEASLRSEIQRLQREVEMLTIEKEKEQERLQSKAEAESAFARRAAAQKHETESVRAESRRTVELLERRLLTVNRTIIDLEIENSQKGLKIQELVKAKESLECEVRAATLAAQQKQQTRGILDGLLGRW